MHRDPRHDILFEPVRIGPKLLGNRLARETDAEDPAVPLPSLRECPLADPLAVHAGA